MHKEHDGLITVELRLGDSSVSADTVTIADFKIHDSILDHTGTDLACITLAGMPKEVATIARSACVAIDRALRHYIDGGCAASTPEMLDAISIYAVGEGE